MEQINELAKAQEQIGKEMLRLLTNMKKDSSNRKTEQYYNERQSRIEALWNEAEENHKNIDEQQCPTHTYFKSKYFEQITKLYEEAIKNIDDGQQRLTVKQSRLKEEEVRLKQVSQIIAQVKTELATTKPSSRYQLLRNKLTKGWDTISEIYIELQVQGLSSNIKAKYEEQERAYEETLENLDTKLEKYPLAATQSTTKSCNISLPQIKLPIFEGRYEEWMTFRDMFSQIVHDNSSLTDIEKMQYLKTHLRGEASRLVQHLQITNDNYNTGWEILSNRYGNERLAINKLIDKILDIPTIQHESAFKLKQLHDTVVECLEALNNLKIDTKQWGPWITRLMSRKWDPETNKLYEQSLHEPQKIPTLDDVKKFLLARFQSLEAITSSFKKYENSGHSTSQQTQCGYCNGWHLIYTCKKFRTLSPQARAKAIKDKKICPNCLLHDENTNCTSSNRCNQCKRFHHTMIHVESLQRRSYPVENGQQSYRSQNMQSTASHIGREDETVFLATAITKVQNKYNSYELLRILVDTGSQSAFITEEAATLLALPRQRVQAEVSGLGAGDPQTAKWKVDTQIRPRFSSNFSMDVQCLVLPKLTQNLPARELNVQLDQWAHKMLADPTFFKPGPIDMILGAKEYGQIILEGLEKPYEGMLGQNTEIGWILSGNISENNSNNIQLVSMTTYIEEDKQLTKFWEIEEIPQLRQMTQEEELCENHYNDNTIRNQDGTYTVRIPFNNNIEKLGASRSRAMARLLQLEKRFLRNKELESTYKQFVQEYMQLGHMVIVPEANKETSKYFMPHQPVVKESSTTTKLRVVFDASCKTSTGYSLNDTMKVGPKLQQELSDILLRWRSHKIVFAADVEKMYRQIKVHPDDQSFQTILWRFQPQAPVKEYRLTTVTYGTTAAPYLAIKTLQRLAEDEQHNFPKAAHIALQDFYVDDLLSGADTVIEALELQSALISMFRTAGFTLRKWSSNTKELLKSLTEMKDESAIEITEDGTRKSLGILWAPDDDTFRFKAKVTKAEKITKRLILSEVAKLFDPLGWLAPVVIKAKLLIQELWLEKLNWDETVPNKITQEWSKFQAELSNVEKIVIPRWTCQTKSSQIELHGFCDASEKAYGAAIYIKDANNDQSKTALLTAKSKIAPVKTKTTLPRLELCSAVLLARLLSKTIAALPSQQTSVYAWTDSMIALSWIKGDPTKWKTFVANRVSEIVKLLPSQHWHHVKTEDNPADVVSRGMEPSKLKNYSPWWHGPLWLKTYDPARINTPLNTAVIMPTKEEAKILCCKITVTTKLPENPLIQRFSTLTRTLRVLSYCKRFINGCKKHKQLGSLTTIELKNTLRQVAKIEQHTYFSEEIRSLVKEKQVSKSCKIASLNPFLDTEGLLRVGGRLQHSQLPYETKHPIILPYHCHLTTLIILDAHSNTLHGGNQLTLTYTRNLFWIINGKKAVRTVLGRCIKCIRFKAQTAEQIMGELPAARVTQSQPFLYSGVDYAGPIQIKTTKGRGHKAYKGYIAIFVCFATKAVHLEVVSDMSSDTFLAAFRRFIPRRGRCAHLYSDNGTNFVGASRILQKEIKNYIQNSDVQDELSTIGTQWHFIPPAAPHFGGLWEAGVKSMKYHFKRIIGETPLTYEEMTTLMHQIEACLNSRPLCPLTDDSDDMEVLTPGHFLIGRVIVAPPDPIVTPINASRLERWKLIQKLKKDIWNRWTSEYLQQLQQRYKWKTRQEGPNVGDLVLLKEQDINPSKWPLARITEVHPSADKTIRVVTVKKTEGSSIKRPIHKLIPLPTEGSNDTRVMQTKTQTSTKKINRWKVLFTAILFITTLHKATAQNYEIHYPQPGLYIEHIGHAQIDRGSFRIEVKIQKSMFLNDTTNVNQAIGQVVSVCEQTKALTMNTQCTSLVQHLREKEQQLKWINKGIQGIITKRNKRGILGKILTSLFGVNDEVYRNIEELDHNQRELIRASNHQTKFMLQALATFNDTETRIDNNLMRFRQKLNEGLEAINEMHRWYNTIDENKISIHILSMYQVVSNYIDEIMDYHTKILDMSYHRGHLSSCHPHTSKK